MNVALRPATVADSGRVADVLLASRAAFLTYAPSPHADETTRGWVRDVLIPRQDVTVATVSDEIVGVMALRRDDGVTWITQLYLAPGFVNQGIGTRLLSHALETVSRPIRLFAFQRNIGARHFYERNGFVPIQFTDGSANEERCPDVLYERRV